MPSFWSLRTRGATAQAVVEVASYEPALVPVEIYTADELTTGLIEDRGFRLSDVLNEVTQLTVERPSRVSFVTEELADPEPTRLFMETERILLAMPPERRSPPQLRVHRRHSRVRIMSSRYELIGTAHHLPGGSLDPYVLRKRQSFIALTDASVRTVTQPYFERDAPVILVNVGPITELKQVITLS